MIALQVQELHKQGLDISAIAEGCGLTVVEVKGMLTECGKIEELTAEEAVQVKEMLLDIGLGRSLNVTPDTQLGALVHLSKQGMVERANRANREGNNGAVGGLYQKAAERSKMFIDV